MKYVFEKLLGCYENILLILIQWNIIIYNYNSIY